MTKRAELKTHDKRAIRGHPSQVWTPGLERRLNRMRRDVQLEGKRILDAGCGVGAFVRRLREYSPEVYGFDVERESVLRGVEEVPNIMLGVGEKLPYRDGTFDVILMHEVLEHVDDDLQTLREMRRVLAPEGRLVIFCPNRLYPFETHGIFFRGKYIFGNIPFVNYFPDFIRNRLVPHANVYTKSKLKRIYRKAGLRAQVHSFVYPGFDHVLARRKVVGRVLRWVLYPLENTVLRIFGLSHYVVLKRKD
ncbi:MAG TPA: methyltransferase domain-containing protein [Dehalococcoidia bacterium]|nr:methyltransferase domain-containing protein [Dehalococcoidia bacterium]